jgi:shikimate dehydrogenase
MKKYLVIGNPIDHSLSPKIHNFWLKKHNISAVYEKEKLELSDLEKIVSRVKDGEIDGVNITTPFKSSIIQYLDKAIDYSPNIQKLPSDTYWGDNLLPYSINTIFKKDKFVLGANTDTTGFLQSLQVNDINVKNKNILILGSGGVVQSIIFILKTQGVKKIYLSNRTKSKAEDIRLPYVNNNKSIIEVVEWAKLLKDPPDVDIIINGTSLGLKKDDVIPLNFKKYEKKIFYDIVYNKKENLPLVTKDFQSTYFLAGGFGNGNHCRNGAAMLILQAASSFSIWHGFDPIKKEITNFDKTVEYVFPDYYKENMNINDN